MLSNLIVFGGSLRLLNQSPNEITNSSEEASSRNKAHCVKELKRHPNILLNFGSSEITAFFSETNTSSHGSHSVGGRTYTTFPSRNGHLPSKQIIC